MASISTLALVTTSAACVLLSVAACSDGDNGWKGGLVMTVHWEHYKDAATLCHKLEAKELGKDPRSFESDPTPHGCRSVKGQDCYVYTGEDSNPSAFGELVQDCFETREADIDRETNP